MLPIVICVLVAGVAFAATVLRVGPAPEAPVTPVSLHRSVEDASYSFGRHVDDQEKCHRARRPREWQCAVSDGGGSSGGEYRIQVQPGSSCWKGRLTEEYPAALDMPKTISACVRREG